MQQIQEIQIQVTEDIYNQLTPELKEATESLLSLIYSQPERINITVITKKNDQPVNATKVDKTKCKRKRFSKTRGSKIAYQRQSLRLSRRKRQKPLRFRD